MSSESLNNTQAVDALLEAVGWGGTLKFAYEGESGPIEEFEDALGTLAALADEGERVEGRPCICGPNIVAVDCVIHGEGI